MNLGRPGAIPEALVEGAGGRGLGGQRSVLCKGQEFSIENQDSSLEK